MIYLCGIEPLQNEQDIRQLYAMASKARKEKADRFRFQKDRLLSLCAEALLRYAWKDAGHALPLPPYSYGANGKPYLNGATGFCFNLSHAGEYVMLAVSDAEIGCDIEQIRPVDPALAGRVLTPDEYRSFEVCREADRDELFCRYWVAKESVLKTRGDGLSADPASVRILLDPPVRATGGDLIDGYAIWEGNDLRGYRYAVCQKAPSIDPQIKTVHLEKMIGGNT